MKKTTLKNLGICLILMVLSGFTTISVYEIKNNTAEVEQYQGINIFTDSKPVQEYVYLGTVNSTFSMDSQYTGVRDRLLKKVRKTYPNANGVILRFTSGGTDSADAIRFK